MTTMADAPISRIRVNFSDAEIEIQGSEDFVEKHLDRVSEIVDAARPVMEATGNSVSAATAQFAPSNTSVPEFFGEWLHQFPYEKLTEADKALIAAYYIQQYSDKEDFTTSDVTDTLDDASIQLSNASRSVSRLAEEKMVYQTRKEGRYQHYKVSKEGGEYLKSLLDTE